MPLAPSDRDGPPSVGSVDTWGTQPTGGSVASSDRVFRVIFKIYHFGRVSLEVFMISPCEAFDFTAQRCPSSTRNPKDSSFSPRAVGRPWGSWLRRCDPPDVRPCQFQGMLPFEVNVLREIQGMQGTSFWGSSDQVWDAADVPLPAVLLGHVPLDSFLTTISALGRRGLVLRKQVWPQLGKWDERGADVRDPC